MENKKTIDWINIVNPEEKQIAELKKQWKIHPIILDELLGLSDRSKVENYKDYLFIVYHFPIYKNETRTSRKAEIDFVVTKNTLITVTYEPLEPLEQSLPILNKKLNKEIFGTAELVYEIIEEVNNFSRRQLSHVEQKVKFVGEELFKRQNKKLLAEISYIKRDLLDFSLITATQKITLESLVETGAVFWGNESKIYLNDLLGDYLKIHHLLENLRATTESYSQTISQIFEFRTSEIIRRFSILGFLTFPLILYATIALQPQIEKTFIKSPADFWTVFGIITIVVIGLAIVFRKKGWL